MLQLDQQALHAGGFQLEYAGGVAGLEQFVGLFIIIAQDSDVEIGVLPGADQLHRIVDDCQVLEA